MIVMVSILTLAMFLLLAYFNHDNKSKKKFTYHRLFIGITCAIMYVLWDFLLNGNVFQDIRDLIIPSSILFFTLFGFFCERYR